MKSFITVLITCMLVSLNLSATNYHDVMKQNITKLIKSNSIEEINQIAATFERIANAEKEEWLPRYYSAYAYARATHFMSDADSIDASLDMAQAFIDELIKSNESESEVHVLQALVYSLRITSASRGYKYSSLSNKSLDRAMQLNAENPRIYYCRGNNVFNTPKMFGGGATKAQKLFTTANEKFESEKNENELWPSWGLYHNTQMLKKCKESN